eukprot:gene15680-19161_t
MDAPDGRRKLHDRPVLRIGGAPIFISLLIGLVISIITNRLEWSNWMPLILCNALIFSVGFADDLKPLGARVKLIGQIGTALILFALGLSIDVLSNPFGGGGLQLGWWSLPLTLLWLVAIPNIINLIDGIDGLAGGISLIAGVGFGIWFILNEHFSFGCLAFSMSGALLGFLRFNFSKTSKIFMGDTGSLIVGYLLSIFAV